MKLIVIPIGKLRDVSGVYKGIHQIDPRLLITGDGVLNPIVLNNKEYPKEIVQLLSSFPAREVTDDEFDPKTKE